jgi:hypothetical protein
VDDTEQSVLTLMRQLRASGATLREVSAALNARRLINRRGGSWSHQFVAQLLARNP